MLNMPKASATKVDWDQGVVVCGESWYLACIGKNERRNKGCRCG